MTATGDFVGSSNMHPVILNGVKDLLCAFLTMKKQILRRYSPQNDILRDPLKRRGSSSLRGYEVNLGYTE